MTQKMTDRSCARYAPVSIKNIAKKGVCASKYLYKKMPSVAQKRVLCEKSDGFESLNSHFNQNAFNASWKRFLVLILFQILPNIRDRDE
jgi:hypothetical protein